MDIKKGDTVQVVSGNDKGRRSTVLAVMKEKSRVIVEGVNMRKHHSRPSSRDPQGGIIERRRRFISLTSWLCVPRLISLRGFVIRSSIMVKNARVSARSGEMIDSQ